MTIEQLRGLPAAPPAPAAPAAGAVRRIHVTDLVLDCLVGVHRHERDGTQRVRVNLEISVPEPGLPVDDRLENVPCYEDVVVRVRRLAGEGHVNLVETLAERIAGICLETAGVAAVRVRVDKLDVFSDAASVGVEIERAR